MSIASSERTSLVPSGRILRKLVKFDILANPDLLVVCGFAIIGLLLTFCLVRFLPIDDIGNVLALAN